MEYYVLCVTTVTNIRKIVIVENVSCIMQLIEEAIDRL